MNKKIKVQWTNGLSSEFIADEEVIKQIYEVAKKESTGIVKSNDAIIFLRNVCVIEWKDAP